MQGSILRTAARDGTALEGMLYAPANTATEKAVLHVHGTWGNFYGNPFIDVFADFYPAHGYSFLTGNNRGHDGGAITEHFADSVLDLQAWIEFAGGLGYRRVILQGHSLGALKAVHYLQQSSAPADPVAALILLSPFDVVAFYSSRSQAIREEKVRRARQLAKEDPDQVVPKDIFDMWLISAASFIDLVDRNTLADIFPFRQGTLSGSSIANVRVPMFAAIGSNDFAAYPSPEECIQQLEQLSRVHAVVIPAAPHNFAGQELTLTKELTRWLDRLSL